MSGQFEGRVALVTGGGRGIGRILALGLAEAGAAVAVVSRTRSELDAVVAEIEAKGGRAAAAVADVVDTRAVKSAVAECEAALGPIDILVSNAGVDAPFGPIGHVDPDDWWHTQAVHVKGAVNFMTAVLPGMQERRAGHIICIASLAGTVVVPNMSAYAVAKSTLIRLVEHVAAEQADSGIAVFSMEPGTIHTSMAEHTKQDPEAQKWIPEGLNFISSITHEQSEASKVRVVEMVCQLASGKYDLLNGKYLDPKDDFDVLAQEAAPA